MSIQWKILGQPGADNALLVTVDSGQAIEHLLFDCGEGCLTGVRPSQIQSIAHLAFSHFHMDHVAGFDTFFRHNYNRPEVPVNLWGPEGTIDLMHHRFRSFSWNLHHDQPGEWIVREVSDTGVQTSRFLTSEAFAINHALPSMPGGDNLLWSNPRFRLEALLLPHGSIHSVAYRLIEADRQNICPEALQRNAITPGAWLQALTDPDRPDDQVIRIDGADRELGELRREFVVTTPGESIAYLTDFRIDAGSEAWTRLAAWLDSTTTLICECQYHSRDRALALQNGHMTSDEVGRLAADSRVDSLALHHLSRRYSAADWGLMLQEAKSNFHRTSFPPEWQISIPEA